VAVRVRPPVRADEAQRDGSALHCTGSRLWLLPKEGAGDKEKQAGARQFDFDWVLGTDTTQESCFASTCGETGVVEGALNGVNGCVMCYGQTGAGKTHTLGNMSPGQEGLVPRAIGSLFDLIARDASASYEVQLAYVQIYMETVHDLLDPEGPPVEIRETPNEGPSLVGNRWLSVSSAAEALEALHTGERFRVTTSTMLNDTSSRSHTVIVLSVRGRKSHSVTHGRLFLVDLAGSERVKRSEVTGVAFEEAVAINTSLTCLGRCVTALAARGKMGRPPFRDSKLTRLLSTAFGGRSTTVLVVCVAPTAADSSETLNSLQFGSQAMSVRVRASANATVDHRALCQELLAQMDDIEAPFHALEAELCAALRPQLAELAALQAALDVATRENGALRWAAAQAGAKEGSLGADPGAETEELARLHAELRELDERIALVEAGAAGADAGAAGGGDAAAARAKASAALLTPQAAEMEVAVQAAWEDVRRLGEEKAEAEARFERARQEVEGEERARHEMETTLYDVAADLGRLALVYRAQGLSAEAVPLYMSAISMYEKTLGPDHPEVAKDLVNLGNALCDLRRHADAEALYSRALAIDREALGAAHPEVAMDLSNLGIVLRVTGRHEEAARHFEEALGIMEAAAGRDDPKTQTIIRNLAATQVIEVDVGGTGAKAPPKLERRLSFTKRQAQTTQQLGERLSERQRMAANKREAALQARVEKARAAAGDASLTARSAETAGGASAREGERDGHIGAGPSPLTSSRVAVDGDAAYADRATEDMGST